MVSSSVRAVCYKLLQSCLALCNPVALACQAPLLMGIFRVRILELVAMLSSRGCSLTTPDWQVGPVPVVPPQKPNIALEILKWDMDKRDSAVIVRKLSE